MREELAGRLHSIMEYVLYRGNKGGHSPIAFFSGMEYITKWLQCIHVVAKERKVFGTWLKKLTLFLMY